ncbi:putative PLP-dependent enzyme possibly involved in cell wall biogenesis [Sphaerochaeta pleomorpha str. Grapes]|uniref:Putative PLP-dependent enzyme possibly involved in cell wall biogenesis n=1 Tax=Sphaerochaeta pleomorpha (strain ATCC BAA-1885 / DSM 22778 / Grapes) TaxID=158190 RepID=G8QWW4_SPHPG|nr:DegT/DnrJ/EryC1/StrS family aminotransferase [Sphaerochaeta pleomorpha]AEV29468.1 putative PLP-dependent enzyme possibly involved in cell wall biogenesis [Sphaerochaeta pleomorpha str. Grapes]
MISFSPPDITQAEIDEVVDTLKSGWITTGPKTKLLEKQLAQFCHTSKVCCLNSATAALELALYLLGVGPGDEVITCAYTYTASCSAIIHVGATPVLVDVAPGSFHLDYDQVAKKITTNTKAIIPIDIGGVMCDYDQLFSILEEKKSFYKPSNEIQGAFDRVIVIGDAAHALGASYNGQVAGSVADFTAFSFHAVKNFTTAEGGALTWKDRDGLDNEFMYHELQLLSLHGQSKDALAKTTLGSWEYDIVYPAYKCNMTDIMASIGIVQLKRYPQLLARRREIIDMYEAAFKDLPVSVMNHFTETDQSSGHLYLLRLDGYSEQQRNAFIIKMAEVGIATNVHYKPLPMHTAYKKLGFDMKDFPNAYSQYENEVTLPLHTSLSNEDVRFIISNVIDCLKKGFYV